MIVRSWLRSNDGLTFVLVVLAHSRIVTTTPFVESRCLSDPFYFYSSQEANIFNIIITLTSHSST